MLFAPPRPCRGAGARRREERGGPGAGSSGPRGRRFTGARGAAGVSGGSAVRSPRPLSRCRVNRARRLVLGCSYWQSGDSACGSLGRSAPLPVPAAGSSARAGPAPGSRPCLGPEARGRGRVRGGRGSGRRAARSSARCWCPSRPGVGRDGRALRGGLTPHRPLRAVT